MSLMRLPNEILVQIAGQIHSVRDIYHLTLVNRLLNDLLEPEIHRCAERNEARENNSMRLLQYADKGDKFGILEMLSLGADINFCPHPAAPWKPAIHTAIDSKDIEFLRFLLENFADPNISCCNNNSRGGPFLNKAIVTSTAHDLAMMTLLLDYGADPNFRHGYHSTPLISAIRLGHFRKMKVLIARGADVNIPGDRGETPLHAAIEKSSFCRVHGRHCIVKALLEAGSEINRVDDRNISPLMATVYDRRGRESTNAFMLTELLLNAGANIHFEDPRGVNAFMIATRNGNEAILRLLQDYGANIHSTTVCGRNAVQEAAFGRNVANLQCLSDLGVDLNSRGLDGRNALYDAISSYYEVDRLDEGKMIQTLEFLLDRGLDVNCRDINQQTPLHFILSFNHCPRKPYKDLDLLVNHGANIEAQDKEGATPLHYAARHGAPNLVNWLCIRKADINKGDKNGETPLFWAMGNGGATMQMLLDMGADDHVVSFHGVTPLCLAAHVWCPQSVATLIQRGADVHHRDNDGCTPLHWFASSKETPKNDYPFQVISILLANGADINARTLSGATPLSFLRKKHPTRRIRQTLVEAGATE